MNVLWITNSVLPAPSIALGLSPPVFGGWVFDWAKQVSLSPDVKLIIATVYYGNEVKLIEVDNIKYYLLPNTNAKFKYEKKLEIYWKRLCEEEQPDIVHIHGTEYLHGLACIRACPTMKYLVSIQGLISIYERYYYASISLFEIFCSITLRDIAARDSIFQARQKFKKRGKSEQALLKAVKNVIGRTNWDRAHVKHINPCINYHFCNESLRAPFYTAKKWDFNSKTNFSIFLSQGLIPLKGLHQVLKAVHIVKRNFPEVRIKIAGHNFLDKSSFVKRIKYKGFAVYIANLIDKLDLKDNVYFTGLLDEQKMIVEYQNAHLFICPSSIENSPNSLGEAQLVGTPTISAYVGGVPDMVVNYFSGLLYRFEEVEMLAELIKLVFTNNSLADTLSVNGIITASIRHDNEKNLFQTLSIYKDVFLDNR